MLRHFKLAMKSNVYATSNQQLSTARSITLKSLTSTWRTEILHHFHTVEVVKKAVGSRSPQMSIPRHVQGAGNHYAAITMFIRQTWRVSTPAKYVCFLPAVKVQGIIFG